MAIKVKKAYENNLKHISLEIPKNKITTITGVSGSGKSSLIYNVLAQALLKAKRRYLASLIISIFSNLQ